MDALFPLRGFVCVEASRIAWVGSNEATLVGSKMSTLRTVAALCALPLGTVGAVAARLAAFTVSTVAARLDGFFFPVAMLPALCTAKAEDVRDAWRRSEGCIVSQRESGSGVCGAVWWSGSRSRSSLLLDSSSASSRALSASSCSIFHCCARAIGCSSAGNADSSSQLCA